MAKIRIISTPNSFKEGGGIHIDPENKGKFNETKRRTGKTTEELTHSSNPLTRKRAIFAQNAAKWKHAEGGNLFGDADQIDIQDTNIGVQDNSTVLNNNTELGFTPYTFKPNSQHSSIPKSNVGYNDKTNRYDVYNNSGRKIGEADATTSLEPVIYAPKITTPEQSKALEIFKSLHGGKSPSQWEEQQKKWWDSIRAPDILENKEMEKLSLENPKLYYWQVDPKRDVAEQMWHDYTKKWYLGDGFGKMSPQYTLPAIVATAYTGAAMPAATEFLSPYVTPIASTMGEATGLIGSEVTGIETGLLPTINSLMATPTGQTITGALNLGFGIEGAKHLPQDIKEGNAFGIGMDLLGVGIPITNAARNTARVVPKVVEGAGTVLRTVETMDNVMGDAVRTINNNYYKPWKLSKTIDEAVKSVELPSNIYKDSQYTVKIGDSEITGNAFRPLTSFIKSKKGGDLDSYFHRGPKDVNILQERNGAFGASNDGGLSQGNVEGKFVSYGEPWAEFDVGPNDAWYELPVGSRREPWLQATNWRGIEAPYTVKEAADVIPISRQFETEWSSIKSNLQEELSQKLSEGTLSRKQYRTILKDAREQLLQEKYPKVLEFEKEYGMKASSIDSIYLGNQTIIPNERWNFDHFFKTPFYKYTEDPLTGQVQTELMMSYPKMPISEIDSSTANWYDWANSRTRQDTPNILLDDVYRRDDFSRGNIRFEIGSSEGSPYSLKSNDTSFMQKLLEGSYRRKMAGLPELFPGEYRHIGNFDGTTFTTLQQSRDIMNQNISRLAEMRPDMSLEDIEKIVRDQYNTPYKVYSREDFTKAGFDPKVGGAHFDNGSIAMVDEEIAKSTPERIGLETHEHRHGLQDNLPRTEEENNILTDAYGDLQQAFKESQEEVLRNYDRAEGEWETLNSDARIKLLGENRSEKWTAQQQNLLIDKMPDEKVIKAVKDADGYGKALVEYYEKNGGVPKEKVQAWRKAMKKVGVVAVPIAITVGLSLPSTSEEQ